jgi:hypothetical protein
MTQIDYPADAYDQDQASEYANEQWELDQVQQEYD